MTFASNQHAINNGHICYYREHAYTLQVSSRDYIRAEVYVVSGGRKKKLEAVGSDLIGRLEVNQHRGTRHDVTDDDFIAYCHKAAQDHIDFRIRTANSVGNGALSMKFKLPKLGGINAGDGSLRE